MTWEEATSNALNAYRGSKYFSEKYAWDFAEKEKPSYALTSVSDTIERILGNANIVIYR
jgi:hypothetical protein